MIAVFGYAVLLKYAGWILFGIWLYFMLKEGLPRFVKWRRNRQWRAYADQVSLYARADYENQEWLHDGIYEGQFPGETMPLTRDLQWHDGVGWEPEDWHLPPDWTGLIQPK